MKRAGVGVCFLVLAGLILALGLAPAASAQNISGSIRGTVTDAQGAAVPGADVTVTSTETGYSRKEVTDRDGSYSFQSLPVSTYNLRVSKDGFSAFEEKQIALHANDALTSDAKLTVGARSETIEVTATANQVETNNGELSGVIQSGQVAELPLNGRNFMELLTLVPGVAPAEAFSITNKGLKGASDVSISGGSSNANQWLVDGANNNDTGSQRTILIYPGGPSRNSRSSATATDRNLAYRPADKSASLPSREPINSTAALSTLVAMTLWTPSTRKSRPTTANPPDRTAKRTSCGKTTMAITLAARSRRIRSSFSGTRNGTKSLEHRLFPSVFQPPRSGPATIQRSPLARPLRQTKQRVTTTSVFQSIRRQERQLSMIPQVLQAIPASVPRFRLAGRSLRPSARRSCPCSRCQQTRIRVQRQTGPSPRTCPHPGARNMSAATST